MQERRTTQRGRTYLGGRIAFNRRQSTMDCVVRNMCEDGAKIAFSNTTAVPAHFDIMIGSKGDSRRGRIVWSNATEAGIAFVPFESDVDMSVESARRIRQLEADRAALARRVAELSEPA